MPTFQTYNVTPILPAPLEPLREMSFNLWWTWEPAARRLFRQLDPEQLVDGRSDVDRGNRGWKNLHRTRIFCAS